ncbi:hypothetical protein [Streptomyces sp. CT34]|uniref:hypothetical protein n=1 Tax=Streptomyces sp. CT34 TaxID=1553907 RepID=UPI0005BDEEBC|nr:hypothetical protein [Streptomyces sp. CT34]
MSLPHHATVEIASGILGIFRGVHTVGGLYFVLGLFGAVILLVLGVAAFQFLRERFRSWFGTGSGDESPDTPSQNSQRS